MGKVCYPCNEVEGSHTVKAYIHAAIFSMLLVSSSPPAMRKASVDRRNQVVCRLA